MTDTNPRPLLAKACEAADDYLMGKVADGSLSPAVAEGLATAGFTVATRILADLRARDGLSETAITESFQRRLDEARATGDVQRAVSAEYTLAIWAGMQEDLADFLSSVGAEQP